MWERTLKSLPPKHEVLAVVRLIGDNKEQVHEDAIWDGEWWTRRRDGEKLGLNSYYLWRKLET